MKFKELHRQDMELLHAWLQRPHVKTWWNDGDDTLEKVQAHYSSNPETTKRFLLLNDNDSPLGYFQYYITPQGIGIDQFLADEASLGKGIGTEAIKQFVQMIRTKHNPEVVLTDPSPENVRAIKCYQKAGFKHTETVVDPNGKMVYLMEVVQ